MRRQWKVHPPEPLRQWQVGAVRVTKISELVLQSGLDAPSQEETFLPQDSRDVLLGIPWLRPDFITADGEVRLAFHALVVETPSRRILIDTCVGNLKQRPFSPSGMSSRATSWTAWPRRTRRPTWWTRWSARTCTWTTWAGTPGWWTAAGCRRSATPATCSAGASSSIASARSATPRCTACTLRS